MFAKAEFTNPIIQKICRTKKYCGIPQKKGHEFQNIFKFCGTTPQIIPTPFFRPVKYFVGIDSAFASPLPLRIWDSTNKIRTFFVQFKFVNSAFANTLMVFFSVRCIIPLFHPPIGVYTRYFLSHLGHLALV